MKNRITAYFFLIFLWLPLLGQHQNQVPRKDVESEIITAVQYFDNRQYPKAEAQFKQIILQDPDNDAAHYYLGLCYAVENYAELAEKHLAKAVQLDSSNFWYRYRLANLYAATERAELTVKIYEGLLKDFPKKNELYYELVDLYWSQNDQEKALETLGQIETIFGKNDALAMARFDLLNRMNRSPEAYAYLESYNKEYSSAQVLATLADYQMSMYNDSTALSYYDEALDIQPGYAPALLGKAEVFRMTRRNEEYFSLINTFMADEEIPAAGKGDYFKAVISQTDPKWVSSFRPQLDTVVGVLTRTHPKDSAALLTAGIYYYSTARNEQAKECLRKNMECWPEKISATIAYVELLMYSSDWDALSSSSRKAYRDFPQEPTFLEMASVADYNLGKYEKVIGVCDTILKIVPFDSTRVLSAYSTIGDMYHKLGDSKSAYKAYDKALKINPEYCPVLNNYAYFLSVEGKKLKQAYDMSRITVEKEPDNPTYLDTFAWILHLMGRNTEAKPFFKHSMLYGGKEIVDVLDHYAEVLFALGEYDLANYYWGEALKRNTGNEIPDLEERISSRKASIKK